VADFPPEQALLAADIISQKYLLMVKEQEQEPRTPAACP
jgi:hypothetical protein